MGATPAITTQQQHNNNSNNSSSNSNTNSKYYYNNNSSKDALHLSSGANLLGKLRRLKLTLAYLLATHTDTQTDTVSSLQSPVSIRLLLWLRHIVKLSVEANAAAAATQRAEHVTQFGSGSLLDSFHARVLAWPGVAAFLCLCRSDMSTSVMLRLS